MAGNQGVVDYACAGWNEDGTGTNYLYWETDYDYGSGGDGCGVADLGSDLSVNWIRDWSTSPLFYSPLRVDVTNQGEYLFSDAWVVSSDYGSDPWVCRLSGSGKILPGYQNTLNINADTDWVNLTPERESHGFDAANYGRASAFLINGWTTSVSYGPSDYFVGQYDTATGNSWAQAISGVNVNGYNHSQLSKAGGCCVVGTASSGGGSYGAPDGIYLASFNAAGSPRWEEIYTDATKWFWGGGALTRMNNGNVLAGGMAYDLDYGSEETIWAAAFSETNGTVWGIQLRWTNTGLWPAETALALPGGDVLLYGGFLEVSNPYGYGWDTGIYLACISSTGTLKWSRKVVTPGDGYVYDLQAATQPNGNICLLAESSYYYGDSYAWIASLSPSGAIQWQHEIAGPSIAGPHWAELELTLNVSPGSRILVTGMGLNEPGADGDIWAATFGADGTLSFARQWDAGWEAGLDWAFLPKKQVTGDWLLGASIGPTSSGQGGDDILLCKMNSEFVLVWSRVYGGANNDYLGSAEVLPSGEVLLAGITSSFGALGYDPFVLGLDAHGNTSQSCWVGSDGNPDTTIPIAVGSASVSPFTPQVSGMVFVPTDLATPLSTYQSSSSYSPSAPFADTSNECAGN